MRVIVAGGSGFLGRALVAALIGRGDDVIVLTRSPRTATDAPSGAGGSLRDVEWHPMDDAARGASGWMTAVDGADAIVNLTGASIGEGRWTKARKAELRDSRTRPTRKLVDAVRAAARRPAVFVQAAGVGIYGTSSNTVIDESFPPGDDFLAQLGITWEAEAQPAAALGCRLVILRSGVVLGRNASAVAKMAMPFRFFVGGPVASGQQYLSWIHLDDWVSLVIWTLDTPAVNGVINATSPEPVTNAEFSRAMGRALRRPSWFPVPAPILRLLFGEMAETVLIRGQRAVPKRARELGFRFSHPGIGDAMRDIFRRRR